METYAVDFDDTHIMSIDPEVEHGERGRVDDAQAVCLSWLERQGGVLVESDRTCDRGWI
jgi:hypothetical protein